MTQRRLYTYCLYRKCLARVVENFVYICHERIQTKFCRGRPYHVSGTPGKSYVPCEYGGNGATAGRTCTARPSSNELYDDINGHHVYRIAAAPSKTAGVVLFFVRERVTTMCDWYASNVVKGLISCLDYSSVNLWSCTPLPGCSFQSPRYICVVI
jgi:hypothetical protein